MIYFIFFYWIIEYLSWPVHGKHSVPQTFHVEFIYRCSYIHHSLNKYWLNPKLSRDKSGWMVQDQAFITLFHFLPTSSFSPNSSSCHGLSAQLKAVWCNYPFTTPLPAWRWPLPWRWSGNQEPIPSLPSVGLACVGCHNKQWRVKYYWRGPVNGYGHMKK
jgi:hypothetical protein